MKRVLYIVQGAAGGVSRYLIDIISNLPRNQYIVGIVFNSEFEDQRFRNWRLTSSNVQFYDISSLCRKISLPDDRKSISQIRRIIRKFNPDVLHAQSSKAGFVGRVAGKLEHVKRIIYTPHAYAFLSPEFSRRKRFIYTLAEKVLSRYFTDKTINCSHSEYEQAMVRKLDRPDKFIVIPNAVPTFHIDDPVAQRKRFGNLDKRFVVGNVARVSHQKNPELFEKIAKETNNLDSSIKFVWIGQNTSSRQSKNVDYLGEMDDTQSLLGGFNLFLSTSYFEGLSYSLLEAASVGIPVLATLVPGNDEFVENYAGATGFNIADDPGDIANKIILILHQQENKKMVPYARGFDEMILKTVKTYQM